MKTSDTQILFTAFISGFCLMVLELLASRLIAPIVGNSLYTWTSIIGVVILGTSLGNIVGGRYIDTHKSPNIIFTYLYATSLYIVATPIIITFVKNFALLNISLIAIVLLITITLFFIPSFLIGCIYPSLFELGKHETKPGTRLGLISATWSTGSIIGTFMTGFVMVANLGSATSLYLIATILFINSFFFYQKRLIDFFPLLLLIILIISFSWTITHSKKESSVIYEKESAYYDIKVVDSKKDPYKNMQLLLLDIDLNGIMSTSGKTLETYPYIYPIISLLNKTMRNALVIGGGTNMIAKDIQNHKQDANITVVDVDPQLIALSKRFFDSDAYSFKSIAADGRFFLNKTTSKYDLIYSDAYNSFISIPWHLSTKEFNDLVKSRLSKNGIYAVNFISPREGDASDFFASMITTFRTTFPNFYVLAFNPKGQELQNIVLIGINNEESRLSDNELKQLLAAKGEALLAQRIVPKDNLPKEDSQILTDAYAPTDALMLNLIDKSFRKHISQYFSLVD